MNRSAEKKARMSNSSQKNCAHGNAGHLWKFLVKPPAEEVSAQHLDSIPEIFSGILAQLA